ncbi:TlpA family protein disulfide reductase [Nonomuraea turcica]|uniref:TlpA family protein disulfide reductase n=1 Tax=Nonomuraea sp. G32 TaxID=3067274 RepID=UPI00273B5940|nr:redoxin domain-containing protein [Nonomuraea sp. G32]MDP4510537.1 redoxin domain-containing protein [Nonomuraea sp. G32]
MIPVRTAAAIATAALLAAGCGGPGQDGAESGTTSAPVTSTMTSAPTASPSTSVTPEPTASQETASKGSVPAALEFSAWTLDGETFQGASLAGKPVVFWFWAPWCPKCMSEAPHVKAAAAQYGDVAFVGVAGLDTEAAMKEFVQRTKTENFPHLSDEKGAVWTKLGVSQQSTFVFMKPDGTTAKASGPLGKDQLDELVRALRDG